MRSPIDRAGRRGRRAARQVRGQGGQGARSTAAADGRVDVLREEAEGKRNSEALSTAGSMLGGLLGGRKSAGGFLGGLLGDAGNCGRTARHDLGGRPRVAAGRKKVTRLDTRSPTLEAELEAEVAALTAAGRRWLTPSRRCGSASRRPTSRSPRSASPGCTRADVSADGETRTLTDGDLNAVPLPIGLRRRGITSSTRLYGGRPYPAAVRSGGSGSSS